MKDTKIHLRKGQLGYVIMSGDLTSSTIFTEEMLEQLYQVLREMFKEKIVCKVCGVQINDVCFKHFELNK